MVRVIGSAAFAGAVEVKPPTNNTARLEAVKRLNLLILVIYHSLYRFLVTRPNKSTAHIVSISRPLAKEIVIDNNYRWDYLKPQAIKSQ
jgi:hypothetical protein